MDMEFQNMAGEVYLMEVNTTTYQYNTGEIERGIITIK